MKVRQWAWLLLAGAVAPFVFDNGPDPVSDGLYRVVDDHGRIGYADAYGVVRIAPRFAFGSAFCERRCQGDLERSSCGSARVGRRISSMGGRRLVLH